MKNKVLILGRNQTAKYELVRELFCLSGQPVPEALSSEPQQAIAVPLVLENKYYTAELGLWLDGPADPSEGVIAYNEVGAAIDALIILASPSEGVQPAVAWVDFIEEWETAITLFIVIPEESAVQTKIADPEPWCIENGFELIDLTSTEEDSGDMERVHEALQSHMWEGMKRKATTNQLTSSIAATEGLLPDHQGDFPDDTDIEAMRRRIFGGDISESEPFAILANLREHAQTLPDDERRELAAQVALSFGLELDESPSHND